MILLEPNSMIMEDTIFKILDSDKYEVVDLILADYDSVSYHISTPETKTQLLISMTMKCYSDLERYGAREILEREFSQYLTNTEQGYNVSLLVDLENFSEDKAEFSKKIGLLKRYAFAAPFEKAFQEQASENGNAELMTIDYRENESFYIKPSSDRVTVVFSTEFQEEMDRVFGKVFLQEFVDARRQPAIQNAPQVLYSNREPPLEIRGIPNPSTSEGFGYVTFVLFPRHFVEGEIREKTISQIQLFRDYLHYHIKCSKAYMHSRMRQRVSDFLKVLNRAKPEVANAEKKTITGRSFRRQ
ncbi:Arp complex subunit [Basidiobolus ranarum]|uniref:Arp2/3 complex 34 kDa subunit n=1 Tax=Basidiobolus ranarum TaxID=34480 RepID=A0ABR2WW88_9FUNG